MYTSQRELFLPTGPPVVGRGLLSRCAFLRCLSFSFSPHWDTLNFDDVILFPAFLPTSERTCFGLTTDLVFSSGLTRFLRSPLKTPWYGHGLIPSLPKSVAPCVFYSLLSPRQQPQQNQPKLSRHIGFGCPSNEALWGHCRPEVRFLLICVQIKVASTYYPSIFPSLE